MAAAGCVAGAHELCQSDKMLMYNTKEPASYIPVFFRRYTLIVFNTLLYNMNFETLLGIAVAEKY